jgi:flagellar biosynthesis chaperone FliJ
MGNTGKDFVHTNRVLADRWSTHNHVHKLHRSATKQIHSEQVAERKIDQDHQSLKNKLFQSIRWRVIKDRKKEFETAVE